MYNTLPNHLSEMDYDFSNCILGRKQYADILTQIIKHYCGMGAVLSINGEWGIGKTTFIRMWKNDLDKQGYKTLYFNAWDADYIDDPLIALLGELKELDNSSSEKLDKAISKVGRIAFSAAPILLQGLIKKYTGTEMSEWTKAIADESVKVCQECVDQYEVQKKSIQEFKTALSDFVSDSAIIKNDTEEYRPVVFFVDELDRCNPDYAVRLLERIKHLFDIPGLVFVLAINKHQLETAIKGHFGSDSMDAAEYLHRFINIEFDLPLPAEDGIKNFCKHLYGYYSFDDFFKNPERIRYFSRDNEEEEFMRIMQGIVYETHLPLRDVDKLIARTRVVLSSFAPNTYLFPSVLFLLCYLRLVEYEFYKQIKESAIPIQGIVSKLEQLLPSNLLYYENGGYNTNLTGRYVLFSIAELIALYNNNERGTNKKEPDFKNLSEDNQKPTFPLVVEKIEKETFFEAIHWALNKRGERSFLSIGYIIERIELLQSIKL